MRMMVKGDGYGNTVKKISKNRVQICIHAKIFVILQRIMG
jgi:hypothetical protein